MVKVATKVDTTAALAKIKVPSSKLTSSRGRGRPVAHWRQEWRPGQIDRLRLPGRMEVHDFGGRVSERVKQLELRLIVLGDRRKILVERLL